MVRKILRTLRGTLGTAVASAVGWVVGTTALLLVLDLFFPYLISSWTVLGSVAQLAGVLGFVSGGLFSLALGTVYRGVEIADLRVSRMMLWGVASGVLGSCAAVLLAGGSLPTDPSTLAILVGMFGGLGGATAGGLVIVAKSASARIEAPDGMGRFQPTR